MKKLMLALLIVIISTAAILTALTEAQERQVVYLIGHNPPTGDAYWLAQHGKLDFTSLEGERNIIEVKAETLVLRLTSIDNVHGFSLPAFDIRETVYPGRVTEVTITPEPGEYYFTCTIVCGDRDHSQMKGKLVVYE